ncbi:hypothetical protein HYQ46_009015 [Verticillium longisporum]|nr:hypothetical protein HYQ46_009015 [Verticillium longisporum]
MGSDGNMCLAAAASRALELLGRQLSRDHEHGSSNLWMMSGWRAPTRCLAKLSRSQNAHLRLISGSIAVLGRAPLGLFGGEAGPWGSTAYSGSAVGQSLASSRNQAIAGGHEAWVLLVVGKAQGVTGRLVPRWQAKSAGGHPMCC